MISFSQTLKHTIGGLMGKYELEFEIEGLPKTPNTLLGRSWFVRSAHAKKWMNLVALHTNRQRPDYPLEKAELTLTRFSSIEPDTDGLVGSFKAVLDALVKLGVL